MNIIQRALASVRIVPVTCVEAGRWGARSLLFAAAERTHFAEGRAAKSRQHGRPTSVRPTRMVSTPRHRESASLN